MPFAPNPMVPVSITASTTLNRNDHMGPMLTLNASGGCTVTLPEATGSGDVYHIAVGTALTTSNYVIAANGTDVLAGVVSIATDVAGVTCPTTATSDKMTLNGGTTGGVVGSYVILTDFKDATWQVRGELISTGTEATPFSAT